MLQLLQLEGLNEFWGIGGFSVGVIALILSIIFYIRGKKKQLLEYQRNSTPLITDQMADIPGLMIAFNGQLVYELVSTTIEFTNSGNQTIHSSDFATLAPLNLITTGLFFVDGILDKSIVSSDNPNLNPQIKVVGPQGISLTFEYLKPKQSFSVSVLHTGVVSVKGDLTSGNLKERENNSLMVEKATKKSKILVYALIVLFAIQATLLGVSSFRKPLIQASIIGLEELNSQYREALSDKDIDQTELVDTYYLLSKRYLQLALSALPEKSAE